MSELEKSVQGFFDQIGFSQSVAICSNENVDICYAGIIRIDDESVELEWTFPDGYLQRPRIFIKGFVGHPEVQKKFFGANIGESGNICFEDPSISWWDPFKAERMCASAYQRCLDILTNNLNAKGSEEALKRDFLGYWNGIDTVYLYSDLEHLCHLSEYHLELPNIKILAKVDERLRLPAETELTLTHWVCISLKEHPSPLFGNSPPSDMSQVLSWLENYDPKLEKFCKALKSFDPKKSDSLGVIVCYHSESNPCEPVCGFRFRIPTVLRKVLNEKRFNPKMISSYFKYNEINFGRYSLSKLNSKYIHGRNLPPKYPINFKNKRIVLVGAGTIGGFIAQQLASLGAGSGPSGKLLIVDPDKLKPENFGRHLLGFDALNQFKAQALTEELKKKFTHLNIEYKNESVFQASIQWVLQDLIIHCTGDLGVGFGLEHLLQSQNLKNDLLVLHSWIYGHGAATVNFLSRYADGACLRCLTQFSNDEYSFRFSLNKKGVEEKAVFQGCHQSYFPYAVAVSMTAASDATSLILDALNNQCKNTLRFNVLRPDVCQVRPDTLPDRSKNCELCGE